MATTKEMLDEAELAKTRIANSDLDEDQKRTYFHLLNITLEATNGISPEQKIQKMTESIFLLAAAQANYLIGLDDKIKDVVANANKEQCVNCKAMKHANEMEEKVERQKIIDEWKAANGITDKQLEQSEIENLSWVGLVKQLILKPYVYVVAGLIVISPYGVDVIKTIMEFCVK